MERKGLNLRTWALAGAEQRLLQIAEETAAIRRMFPELQQRGYARKRRADNIGATDGPARKRRRKKMSAEARKRISDAQRARWAKQRARAGSSSRK
jgi:hypothetical protein